MSGNHSVARVELNGLWHSISVARRWRDYPQSQSYAKAQSVCWSLLDRFDEPHRAYHNTGHILALLEHAAAAGKLVADPHRMAMAIWFHDAVYDPDRTDNETESAALAHKNLKHLGEKDAFIDDVAAMILATIKHQLPEKASSDMKLFLDFDLSILGAAPDIYAAYAAAIRAEYRFVPDDVYRTGRRAVLEKFQNREKLYFTEYGAALWETQARTNLQNEIASLS